MALNQQIVYFIIKYIVIMKYEILLIIVIVIIGLYLCYSFFNKYPNNEGFDDPPNHPQISNKKYAVCLWGELRAIKTIRDNFYKNLVDPLNADVFIVVQKGYKDEDINLFNDNVITKIAYDKPSNSIYTNYDKLEKRNNYIINPCLQIYYNWYYIYEKLGDLFESKYEYVILSRSEFQHMFEFPDIVSLCDKPLIWVYEGHDYMGINTNLVCVPTIFIKKYLSCYFEYLQDEKNVNKLNGMDLNIEKYAKLMFDENEWKIGKLQNNAFVAAESMNEKTTWGSNKYSEKHKVFYKYDEQLNNTFNALTQYDNGERWKYVDDINDKIILSK
jgi:hypothetical protein